MPCPQRVKSRQLLTDLQPIVTGLSSTLRTISQWRASRLLSYLMTSMWTNRSNSQELIALFSTQQLAESRHQHRWLQDMESIDLSNTQEQRDPEPTLRPSQLQPSSHLEHESLRTNLSNALEPTKQPNTRNQGRQPRFLPSRLARLILTTKSGILQTDRLNPHLSIKRLFLHRLHLSMEELINQCNIPMRNSMPPLDLREWRYSHSTRQ